MGNETSTETKRSAHHNPSSTYRDRSVRREGKHPYQSPLTTDGGNHTGAEYSDFFKRYSPYRILGVSESDSLEYILQRYRALLKTYHPDKGGDVKKFHLIKEAFAQINLVHEESNFSHSQAKQNHTSFVKNQSDPSQPTEKSNIEQTSGDRAIARFRVPDERDSLQSSSQIINESSVVPPTHQRDAREFLEKFNRQFQDTQLKNDNVDHGYSNLNWEDYDRQEKKYEIISYEDINYQPSGEVYAESLDNSFVQNFSKYPTMGGKNLNYTDFLQAYTTDACILPDSHEKIWNQHFTVYHDRDLRKIKSQRESTPELTVDELARHRNRIDCENKQNESRGAEWRQWVAQQTDHYQSRQFIQ